MRRRELYLIEPDFEQRLYNVVRLSGFEVLRERELVKDYRWEHTQTPDVVLFRGDAVKAIIECREVTLEHGHEFEAFENFAFHGCGSDAYDLDKKQYYAVESKAGHYKQLASELKVPYIIALNDKGCGSDNPSRILFGDRTPFLEIANSGDVVGGGVKNIWDEPEDGVSVPGIFGDDRNAHVSGLIYAMETARLALWINPFASMLIPDRVSILFQCVTKEMREQIAS